MKYALIALALIGVLVAGSPSMAGTWPFPGGSGGVAPTSTPAVVVNKWSSVVCDGCGAGNGAVPEMASTPTGLLIQEEDINQEPSLSNLKCGVGIATACLPQKYISFLANACATPQQIVVLAWQGANGGVTWTPSPGFTPGALPTQSAQETAFQHFYNTNPTPSPAASPFRLVDQAAAAPKCTALNPSGAHAILYNPIDSAFLSELQTAIWTNTASGFYPAPYGVYSDNSKTLGSNITGGGSAGAPFSTEYSCGWNSGSPCAINVVGTGTFHVAVDYDTGLGTYVNSASPLKVILNGGAPLAVPTPAVPMSCSIIVAGHCHDGFITGDIDNNYEKAYHNVIVANTNGNLSGWDLESPFFNHLTSNFCGVVQCLAMLNTFVNFQIAESGNSVKLYDLEPSWGTDGVGGAGEPNAGRQTRLFALAAEWLAPDPTTGTDDRIIPKRLTVGGSPTETASFFELTGVPFAPEHALQTYVWNGTTVTLGGGCHGGVANAQGDLHGIIDLLVACGSDDGGTYVQQYGALYFNGVNFGKMAVIINTSATTTQTISSGWFTADPFSSYQSQMSLTGGEVRCVAYAGVNDGDTTNCAVANNTAMRNCTNAYCNGAQSLAGNVSAIPLTIPPDSGLILVAEPH